MHLSSSRGLAVTWTTLVLLSAGMTLAAESAHPANVAVPSETAAEAPESDGSPWVFGCSAAIFQQSGNRVATRIAGWTDASYRDNGLPGHGASLNLDRANLFLDTRFRVWQLFVEAEFEHETTHTGFEREREIELEQALGGGHPPLREVSSSEDAIRAVARRPGAVAYLEHEAFLTFRPPGVKAFLLENRTAVPVPSIQSP